MGLHVRQPVDEIELSLLENGWEFAGLNLFQHPEYPRRYFTRENAIICDKEIGHYMTETRIANKHYNDGFDVGFKIGASYVALAATGLAALLLLGVLLT
jgi:hypothetical protein